MFKVRSLDHSKKGGFGESRLGGSPLCSEVCSGASHGGPAKQSFFPNCVAMGAHNENILREALWSHTDAKED